MPPWPPNAHAAERSTQDSIPKYIRTMLFFYESHTAHAPTLVNRYPSRWNLAQRMWRAIVTVVGGVLRGIEVGIHLSLLDVRLQALIEVPHAHECHDHRDDQQQQGQDGESGEGVSRGFVINRFRRVVHTDQFEHEIGHCCKVDEDDQALTQIGFFAGDPSCDEKKDDGYRHCCDRQAELSVRCPFADHDQKLDSETKEEEEVKLQQRNVDLYQLSASSTIVTLCICLHTW